MQMKVKVMEKYIICYNTGKISSTTQESQSGGCTGGIYGLFRSMTSATLEIKNSYILEELV